MNPGDTRYAVRFNSPPPAALNQGRGVNPGDTVARVADRLGDDGRSTKAGA